MSDQGLDVAGHPQPILGPERLERLRGVLVLQEVVVGVGELSGFAVELDLLERQQRHPLRSLILLDRLFDRIGRCGRLQQRPQNQPERHDSHQCRGHRLGEHQSSTSANARRSRSISSGDAGAGVDFAAAPGRSELSPGPGIPAPSGAATATRLRESTATSAPPATRIAEPGSR
jgi:hypothetical protein